MGIRVILSRMAVGVQPPSAISVYSIQQDRLSASMKTGALLCKSES
jgi:hypothetical protein